MQEIETLALNFKDTAYKARKARHLRELNFYSSADAIWYNLDYWESILPGYLIISRTDVNNLINNLNLEMDSVKKFMGHIPDNVFDQITQFDALLSKAGLKHSHGNYKMLAPAAAFEYSDPCDPIILCHLHKGNDSNLYAVVAYWNTPQNFTINHNNN